MKIIDILREEAARGGYTVEELRADDRTLRVTKLRQYAMWRARNETGRSLKEIGRMFRRDHTSVHHGWQKIEAMTPEERLALPPKFAPPPVKVVKPVTYRPRPRLYYPGADCSYGHGGRRYIATGVCVECKRLRDLRSRQNAKAKSLDAGNGREATGFGCAGVE
jgi:hypothetical protein